MLATKPEEKNSGGKEGWWRQDNLRRSNDPD